LKIHQRRISKKKKKNNNDNDKVMGNPYMRGKTIRNVNKKSCHVERDVKIAYSKLLLGTRIIGRRVVK
jgi:hypothetical protein